MLKKSLACLLFIALLAVSCVSLAEEFSLRGGVRFGMSPEEVIAIERSNGFEHDLTTSGETLFDSGRNHQLYYQDNNIGKLGQLPILRYEYDFTWQGKKLYQFYYVFRQGNAFEYLSASLTQKYGQPNGNVSAVTELYTELGSSSHVSYSQWTVGSADDAILIDLWDNKYGVSFLVYQPADSGNPVMTEQQSLDFGL